MVNPSDRTNEKPFNLNATHASGVESLSPSTSQWLILKSGFLYFLSIFGIGFLLGIIRVFWIVPYFGTKVAELMEMPLMLIAIIVIARWLIRQFAIPSARRVRLGMGIVALSFLLIAEFGTVLSLRGMSISEYIATRDPVSGTIYYLMLGVFAAMPWLVSWKRIEH
jgi:hypothetical protein